MEVPGIPQDSIFVLKDSTWTRIIRTDMAEVPPRYRVSRREVRHASPANLVEDLEVGRIHSLQLVGCEQKDCGIDMMGEVLKEVDKPARVQVVALEEGHRLRPLQWSFRS